MTDKPRYRAIMRSLKTGKVLVDAEIDHPRQVDALGPHDKGVVVQLQMLRNGVWEPMKGNPPVPTIEAVQAAINDMDQETRAGLAELAQELRDQHAAHGPAAVAAFWAAILDLVLDLETERDAAWQATLTVLDQPAGPEHDPGDTN